MAQPLQLKNMSSEKQNYYSLYVPENSSIVELYLGKLVTRVLSISFYSYINRKLNTYMKRTL